MGIIKVRKVFSFDLKWLSDPVIKCKSEIKSVVLSRLIEGIYQSNEHFIVYW